MPNINEFAKAYDGKVGVFAITEDQQGDTAKYIASSGFGLNVLIDKGGRTAQKYNLGAYPTTVIIDKDRKIVDAFTGKTDFMDTGHPVRSTIDSLLGESGENINIQAPAHLSSRSA